MSSERNVKFHKWSGTESEFSHENTQINNLINILKKRIINIIVDCLR